MDTSQQCYRCLYHLFLPAFILNERQRWGLTVTVRRAGKVAFRSMHGIAKHLTMQLLPGGSAHIATLCELLPLAGVCLALR